MGDSTASLAEHVRDLRQPACQVGEQQPAQLAGAEGQVPKAFHPSSMLATCHQRFLALHVGRFETVEELTKDEGYNGERKEDIGEQVRVGESLASEVHHQVEAGEVVALAHGLLSVAQLRVQLATLFGPFLGLHVPKSTHTTGWKIFL